MAYSMLDEDLSGAAPKAPAYQFRDDRNAQLDRDASAQADAAKANPFQAAPAAPAAAFAPVKPQGSGYEGFVNDLEAGAPTAAARPAGANPFTPVDTKAQVSGAISRLLSNPTGGYDQAAQSARERATMANQTANEDLRSQAALAFLPGTGQALGPVQQQTDQQLLAMRDMDLQAAAGRGQAEQAGLQSGISAGLQQNAQDLAMRQFESDLGERKARLALDTELGRGSLELNREQAATSKTLGFADLNLREKSLAQSAGQFQDEMSFRKDALAKGATEAEAQRAWQASENEKARGFQGAQSELDRSLASTQFSQRLDFDKTQFQEKIREFTSEQDFQTWAKTQDISQVEAQRTWQAHENDIQRNWQSGERLSNEDFQTLINKNNQIFESAQNDLNRVLQLNLQGNAQSFQAAQTAASQAFEKAMQESGQTHDTAMQVSQQVFQQKMQEAGFTQEQTMQAAQLTQQANIANQQAWLQERMHMADLAQNDAQFAEKIGLDRAQLDAQKEQFGMSLSQHAEEFAQQFGLDSKRVEAALSSQAFQDEMEKVQIGMQLTEGNPEAAKMFASSLAATMGKALGFTPEQIEQGRKLFEANGGETGTTAASQQQFDSILTSKAGFVSDDAKEQAQTMAKTLTNLAPTMNPDGSTALPRAYNSDYQKAADRLRNMSPLDVDAIVNREDQGDGFSTKYAYNGTPAFADYTAYVRLLGSGMKDADAKEAFTALVGSERAKAALELESGPTSGLAGAFAAPVRDAIASSLKASGKSDAEIATILKELGA